MSLKFLRKIFDSYPTGVLCAIHAILAISVAIAFIISFQANCLMIKMDWDVAKCNSVNQLWMDFVCSYIAAYIIWLFTVILPDYIKRQRIESSIRKRYEQIRKNIRAVTFEFSRGTTFSSLFDVNQCRQLLATKNWDDPIPMFQQTYKISISYWRYIVNKGQQINNLINDFLAVYVTYLSDEQINILESIRDADIVKTLGSFVNMNITVNPGVSSLIKEYVDMIALYNKADSFFNHQA